MDGPVETPADANAAVQRHWRSFPRLSSIGDMIERFLGNAGFDKGPWLVVAFIAGISAWFVLGTPLQWWSAIGLALSIIGAVIILWRADTQHVQLRQAVIAISLMFALGVTAIWLRSEIVGASAIDQPQVSIFNARILERDDQPAQGRMRLVLAMRNAETGAAQRVRVNVPIEDVTAGLEEGSINPASCTFDASRPSDAAGGRIILRVQRGLKVLQRQVLHLVRSKLLNRPEMRIGSRKRSATWHCMYAANWMVLLEVSLLRWPAVIEGE